jgi:predicted transcriptional regulator
MEEKKMTCITVQVPNEMKEALEEEAGRLTVSVSAIIRQQLAFFLKENAKNIATKAKKQAKKG